MKALRIAGIVILTVIVLLIIGGLIFLKTVDINKYVPVIEQQVKKAIGRDLKIGRADLTVSLFKGLSLEVSKAALSDDPQFSNQAFISADKILLGLSLRPLIFERKIQILNMTVIAPAIVIIRNKAGLINAATLGARVAQSEGSKKDSASEMAALPALLADHIKITDATLTYIDETFDPKIALVVDQIDFTLQDFSLTDVFTFELNASVFSKTPNVKLEGKARVDLGTLSAWITDTKLSLDLAKVSTQRLNQMLPMIAAAGLKDSLKGQIAVSVPELRAGANGLQALKMSGSLTGGYFEASPLPFPLEDIALTFTANERDLLIKSCDFLLAEGNINVAGTVYEYLSLPRVDLTGKVEGLELAKVSEAYQFPVKISGKANADIKKLIFEGKVPRDMALSLKTEIAASLKDGVLDGINLLKLGLGNIPMLPALWDMVQPGLPPETQEDLKKGRTLVESLDVMVKVDGKEVIVKVDAGGDVATLSMQFKEGLIATIERAELVTRDVIASVKGMVRASGEVKLDVELFFQKKLSDALIKNVSDLAGIRNDQGKIYIPIKVTGSTVKPQFQPDVDYLTKKLIMNRGKEELQKVLEKNPEVQGVLNAIFGTPKSDTQAQNETDHSSGQEDGAPAEGTQSGAAQAADAILNSLFKKK